MDIQKTVKNLKARGFCAQYFQTREEAIKYIQSNVKDTVVGIGGSKTIDSLELYNLLFENGNTVHWHWKTPGIDTIKNANSSPVYICSANAISEDGEIVNIDGSGNRVSSIAFGEKHTIIIAGTNKITPNLESAIFRARNTAAVLNAERFDYIAPCKTDKECHNCLVPERVCKEILITLGPVKGMKVEVIIIDEELGF